ncbi:MAG: hypothetical protein KAJ75_02810, partial [Alphaproteobacteria bacterium]|nr:hypothetical protein [Alphaproteobacteria bacterium]
SVPLAGIVQKWRPDAVLLNGKPLNAARYVGSSMHAVLPEGTNFIVISGSLPASDSVQLNFPLQVKHLKVKADGWKINGVRENGISDANIQLTRIKKKIRKKKEEKLTPATLPPFMTVERIIDLGINWSVETIVRRSTPSSTGAVIEVPLLDGESVTSANVEVKDGKAQINLGSRVSSVRWTSVLKERNELVLEALSDVPWVETWKLNAGNIWHVEMEGIPRIQDSSKTPVWRPWAGEKVTIHITRPLGIDGAVKTIDKAKLEMTPSLRSVNTVLEFTLRSSRGTQHDVILPENTKNQVVYINNKKQPLRMKERAVTFPVVPGSQTVKIQWTEMRGIERSFKGVKVNLGLPSVNIITKIKMPNDRWILFAGGSQIGPVFLFWSLIPIIILLAFGMS